MSAALQHDSLPSRLVAWVSNFENEQTEHSRTIYMHPFNSQVEVFFPFAATVDTDKLTKSLTSCFDNAFFYEFTCPLADLLQSTFLEPLFTNRARVCGLSANTPLDHSNVVAFLPSGRLYMVLDKDSIEQLGLAGSSSPFVHDPRRFRVEIDISACSFRPGKKLYDRVQWCLSAERVAPIKFRMACVRDGSSVDIQFPPSATGVRKVLINSSISRYSFRDLSVPLPQVVRAESVARDPQRFQSPSAAKPDNVWECAKTEHDEEVEASSHLLDEQMSEFFDYLGLISCRLESNLHSIESIPDEFLSSYQCFSSCDLPESHIRIEPGYNGLAIRWRGFIAAEHIAACLRVCRELQASDAIPWCSLIVHGNSDAPVSWMMPSSFEKSSDRKPYCHHDYFLSGEQHFAYVILNESQYWMYRALGPLDECS